MTDISTKRYNLDNFEASFREFLQNHARAGQAPPLQSNSIKNYLSDLRHFMGFMSSRGLRPTYEAVAEANTPRNDISNFLTIEAVNDYKNYLMESNLPIKTINRRLSTLRKFCSFCISQNWMKENPAKRVGNVGAVQSLSLRGTSETSDAAISGGIASSSGFAETPRNDMINEFKQYLLSGQADPNVETGHAPSLHKNSDTNLILDDVQEFLSICHLA